MTHVPAGGGSTSQGTEPATHTTEQATARLFVRPKAVCRLSTPVSAGRRGSSATLSFPFSVDMTSCSHGF